MSFQNTLYLVATPIGHRNDLTLRAIEVLRGVARVYAEDTRHSLPLLRHHGIPTPVEALHEHNEGERAASLAARLVDAPGDAALISDAGTPLVSDPGYRLVRACIDAGVRVSPVPGPSALLAALSVSGLPTDRFEFAGFPPSKPGARRQWLDALAAREHTLVLYESPHRIVDSLADIAAAFGDARPVAVARELTKKFETVLRGTATEVHARVAGDADQRRGEFVVVIGGASARGTTGAASVELDRLIAVLSPQLPPKAVAKAAAELLGANRREAYARVVALGGHDGR